MLCFFIWGGTLRAGTSRYKQDKGREQAPAKYFGDVLCVDKQAAEQPSTTTSGAAPLGLRVFLPFLCSLYPCVFYFLRKTCSNDAP